MSVVIMFLLLFSVNVQAEGDHTGHNHGPDEEHYEEEFSAEDYIGIYMEVPEKAQMSIGLRTEPAQKSDVKGKVLLNGRIPQDVQDIIEVYVPQSGILQECSINLGEKALKDQVLCSVKAEDSDEIIDVSASRDGIVIAQFSKPGERVATISPLLTLADYSKIPVTLDVYEKDIGKIKLKQKVSIFSSAYPDKTFQGRVTFISPRFDETAFTLKIRVLVDNPDYYLKPGMFVRAEAGLESPEEHVSVPSFSVQNLDGIDVVFVQDEPESFIPTEVEVAYIDQDKTIVKGDIYAGDLVVVEGAYNLKSKILESEIVGGCAHGH